LACDDDAVFAIEVTYNNAIKVAYDLHVFAGNVGIVDEPLALLRTPDHKPRGRGWYFTKLARLLTAAYGQARRSHLFD
jgi:hypothetical protein